MEKIDKVKELLKISPIERGMMDEPVSLEEISLKYNIPISIVEELNKGDIVKEEKVVEVDEEKDEEVEEEDKELPKVRGINKGEKYDAKRHIKRNLPQVTKALLKKAIAGNVNAATLAYKIMGLITEKNEIKIEAPTREEIMRRNLEAERDLRKLGFRVKRADGQVLEDGLVVPQLNEPKIEDNDKNS